ncbi:hypothetical protein [Flavobacterium glaciei]|uniref:T9SS C-terminal target domain-containing protein n=1 Tax=Flavobacterium glaciei TaxID=386300 RepID=A0A562PYS0_9FLAO|nr:hypothetical protein [Flavobacterium glaciei]RDI57038.1 hypothetical protein DFR66_103226 [Flavobacterium glaciei]TWI49538.1 hypothetical protein IQ02_00939 [Flavobacterium glaciei]
MKKNLILMASLLSAVITLNSCSNDDNPIVVDVTPPTATPAGPVELTGDLATRTLTKDKKYLIKGQVFVRSGAVLTIEPGTVIFGDKASKGTLVIDRGGKIIADGTAAAPIVFTSGQPAGTRDRGDWGGLVILGNAPVNQPDPAIEGITPAVIFGGTNNADNSGILKYVRVEFAGIELTPNNETNSITLGGVGSGTQMDYTQVSFGGDDGFEWFGGSVNSKHLVAFAMWDDCFDVDFGFTGKVQFGVAVRYGSYADQSGSNIFETDNGPNDNLTTLITTGVFSNITGIGPKITNTQSINGNFQHALDLRRRTALTIANSAFVGMPRGLRMNQQSVVDNYTTGTGVLLNNYMSAPLVTFSAGTGMTANAAAIQTLWNATNETNTSTDLAAVYLDLGLNTNIFFGNNTSTGYASNPDFRVTAGALTAGAAFTNAKLADAFFTRVAYRGAFGTTDWTDGWAEFNPIAKVY